MNIELTKEELANLRSLIMEIPCKYMALAQQMGAIVDGADRRMRMKGRDDAGAKPVKIEQEAAAAAQ